MKSNIEEEIFKLKANIEEHEERAFKATASRLLCKMFCPDIVVKPNSCEVLK